MQLPIIDLFFILVIALCALSCLIKGFVDSVFNKASPILALLAGVLFYKFLLPLIEPYIKVKILAAVLSFLLIFVFVFILAKIIQMILGNIFEGRILGSLDRTLGFMFGLVEGFALVALILIIMVTQPWFDVSKALEGSLFFSLLKGLIAIPVNTINDSVKNAVASF